ncbi:glycosyl hydrolase family 28-related protein [Rhodococcoides fascians]|uniref:glycosyl hydrolase family 28-related protein n=1 Tax=Rhodococcoides fascians TaxID=1828 RepID=UPI00050BFE21|nr:glycosyl hydrolase family 28-related protein [Rhodococcus fascians]
MPPTRLRVLLPEDAPRYWKPNTAYLAGDVRSSPAGIPISRIADGTSRTSFDSTETALWSRVTVPTPTSAGTGLDVLALDSSAAGGVRWSTSHEQVARAVSWNIVTDPRFAGGAKGDGTTDDSAAITAAITAATQNGRAVFFPAGDYRGENIVVPNYVHLIGATAAMTRFGTALTPGTGTRRGAVRLYRLSTSSTNPLVTLQGAGSGLINIWLENTGAPGTALVQQGFETTLENVRCFNGTGIGIDVQKGNNNRWRNVYVDNFGSATLPAVKIWSKTGVGGANETNSFDVYGLTIERQANVALEIGIGSDSTENYAEFIRIVNLHIEAPADAGGVQNVDPLIRFGNVRGVTLIDPYIYGGSGPLFSHEYQATRGNPLGSIKFVGGYLLGRKSDIGGTPAVLGRLISGNAIAFLGTTFDMCTTAAVTIDVAYGNDVFFDDACVFTSRVPAAMVDNRTGVSYYRNRGFLTVEQDLTILRHLIAGGGALTGSAVSSGTGTPSLQNLSACNDRRGKVLFGSGATPTAGQAVAILTFAKPFATAPIVQVNPSNGAAAALGQFFASTTTTTMTIFCSGTMAASQAGGTYQATYIVEG